MEEPEEQEDFSDVYEAVRELPDKYRDVIHLFYYEQLTVKDIAGILDTKEATVKTCCREAGKLFWRKIKGGIWEWKNIKNMWIISMLPNP